MRTATILLSAALLPAIAIPEKPPPQAESPAGAIRAGDPAWKLVWSDDFDKPGLPDPKKWSYEIGRVRNREAQTYTEGRKENARVEDGSLVIEARREKLDGAEYTSASLHTKGKGEWRYGRVEVRAKLPSGRGMWPAIWMLGVNMKEVGWPRCGEIDIMENVGFDPDTIHANIHTRAYNHVKKTGKGAKITVSKPHEGFHVYAVDWLEDRLDFFVDGKRYFTYANDKQGEASWPFDRPHYLILNAAIGGSWGGQKGIDDAIFPQKYFVDYVRVYERQKTASAIDSSDELRPRVVKGEGSLRRTPLPPAPAIGGISDIVFRRAQAGGDDTIVVAGTAGAVFLKPGNYEVLRELQLNDGKQPFLGHRAIDADGDEDVDFLREPGPGRGAVLLDDRGQIVWERDAPGGGFAEVACGDIDGDRRQEFLLHSSSSRRVALLDCQGNTLWKEQWESSPSKAVILDTDGDATAELVSIDGKSVCIRDGKGALRLRQEVQGAKYVNDLAVARIPGESWRPALYLGFNRAGPGGELEQQFRLLDLDGKRALKDGPAPESPPYLTQVSVRLEAGQAARGARIWELNQQAAIAGFTATRLLLEVYDATATPLYTEVIGSPDAEVAKGDGAIASVPSSAGNEEVLLVGYGPQLIEYRRR